MSSYKMLSAVTNVFLFKLLDSDSLPVSGELLGHRLDDEILHLLVGLGHQVNGGTLQHHLHVVLHCIPHQLHTHTLSITTSSTRSGSALNNVRIEATVQVSPSQLSGPEPLHGPSRPATGLPSARVRVHA